MPGTKLESAFGPCKMGAGPAGIAGMQVKTGAIKYVVSVPFQKRCSGDGDYGTSGDSWYKWSCCSANSF
ncbi:hypothetical protein ADIARSV_1869 [Arcticibacter svalbardensis MN12-7]|uniref:Uncharacterized protein n=1 Tax=Arcticibacter svalbardensis MN12-7 TaxID=1150600 RepID=R9GT88_9SPHI|nr:hypothetical protein [Arcticibacter svalbardensis]EOR94908.1 hypothetical protein ADIARSV_1869 [Arcticibacter svalbardensis MN12-7]